MQQKKVNESNTILKYGSYTILVILIITFVGAPIISNRFGQSGTITFGKYASYTITYKPDNYFGQRVQSLLQQLSEESPELSNNQFFISNAWRNAFNQTVLHYATLDLAKKSKYSPTEQKVINEIKSYSWLQTDGEFDSKLYDTISNTDKKNIIELQTEYTTANKVQRDIIVPPYISRQEIEFLRSMNDNKRAFSYIRLDKNKAPDDDLLIQYGIENKDTFYRISFKSITVASESEAQTIYDNIINRIATFEESATTYSTDSGKDSEGTREPLYAYQVKNYEGQEALDAMLALQDTESITGVIKTAAESFAIYGLREKIVEPNFESNSAAFPSESESDKENADTTPTLLQEVENYINTYEPAIIEDYVIDKAEDFIARAQQSGFTSAAEEFGFEAGTTNLFPLNIDNMSVLDSIENTQGPDIPQLQSEQDILSRLFKMSIDELSEPYIMGSYVVVFQLDEIVDDTNKQETVAEKFDEATIQKNLNDFQQRYNTFIFNTNFNSLRDAIVNENKLTDNYTKAFSTIYGDETQ